MMELLVSLLSFFFFNCFIKLEVESRWTMHLLVNICFFFPFFFFFLMIYDWGRPLKTNLVICVASRRLLSESGFL